MRRGKSLVLWVAGSAVMISVAVLPAQEVLDPESITVTGVYSHWGTRYPQNALTGPGDSITRETMWTTANNHEPGYIVFSLNDRVQLTQLEIWNWNNDWNTIGMKDVEILVSTDWGITYQAITNPANQTTVFTLTQGPNNDTIQPDLIPMDHTATHLKIDPITWYGIRAGLSYVKFYGTRPGEQSARNRQMIEMTVHEHSGNTSGSRVPENTIDGTPYGIDVNYMWLSLMAQPWIVFDLDGVRHLNHLNFWNYAQDGYTNRGMQDIRISGSLDGITFTPLSGLTDGEYTLRQALATDSSLVGEFVYISLPHGGGSEPMAYLKIECLTTYGGTSAGLSEIQFFERLLPPAGSLIIFK